MNNPIFFINSTQTRICGGSFSLNLQVTNTIWRQNCSRETRISQAVTINQSITIQSSYSFLTP